MKTLEILRSRGITISDKSIREGFSSAKWPGRMQFIKDDFLIDCAHNPDGVEALCTELKIIRKDFMKIILVTGIMRDKDIEKMCNSFNEVVDEVIITRPRLERASVPEEISKYITKSHLVEEDVLAAVNCAFDKQKKSATRTLVVLAGSIFTVGEALERLGIAIFD